MARRTTRRTPRRTSRRTGQVACTVERINGQLRRICRNAKGQIKSNSRARR